MSIVCLQQKLVMEWKMYYDQNASGSCACKTYLRLLTDQTVCMLKRDSLSPCRKMSQKILAKCLGVSLFSGEDQCIWMCAYERVNASPSDRVFKLPPTAVSPSCSDLSAVEQNADSRQLSACSVLFVACRFFLSFFPPLWPLWPWSRH